MTHPKHNIGIVLTGGGARGAYQAGALNAILEMCEEWGIEHPFNVVSGNSAGAINASYYAAGIHKPRETVDQLMDLWSKVHSRDVFEVGYLSLAGMALKWLFELSTGSLFVRRKTVRALLDTSPLRGLIETNLNIHQIEKNIEQGFLRGLAIKAANYSTGYSETFIQGIDEIELWKRHGRISRKDRVTIDHIMASTAIPILFPPVKIGRSYYGDGSLRSYTPFSPVIKMGANRIVTIGVSQSMTDRFAQSKVARPSIGRILSLMLNSVLLDAIDLDIERLDSMNRQFENMPESSSGGYRKIEHCLIRPSVNLGKIAAQEIAAMPKTIKHLLTGLGSKRESADLTSYLLFEPSYTKRLIELGYNDTMNKKDELHKIFTAE